MGIISKLRSFFGARSEPLQRDADVTVERERSGDEEPAVEAIDASDAAAEEPSEAEDADEGTVTGDIGDVESDAESGDAADTEDGAGVETIKGIGPAYAERLHDAGIETVDGLADADADDLADAIDLSPKRVRRWIDRTGEREERR